MARHLTAPFAVLAALAGAAPAFAQQPPVPAVVAPTYKLQIGDTFSIAVFNHPEFSVSAARIQVDRTFAYVYGPLLGEGKTTGEIAAEITRILKVERKQLKNPIVTVAVLQREARQVNLYGPVRSPGRVEWKETLKLLDVLASAGGLPSDRYEFYKITLYRADGSMLAIDVEKLYGGDAGANVTLQPSDNIVVSELDQALMSVRVVGEVRNQTTMVVPRDGSIVALLNAAGGPTPAAALSKASILRKGETIPIDLRGYLKDGRVPPSAKLLAGDTLVIPLNRNVYRINGAVTRGGELPYPDERTLTLFEALSQAGIVTQAADLKKVTLTRHAADGQDVTSTVDVNRMLKGDLSADMPIQADDNIFVPLNKQARRFSPTEIFGMVNAVSIFYNFLRNVR